MTETPIHIKFQNQQNSNAGFDLIRLEELYTRIGLDHSPYQLHVVEFYLIMLIENGNWRT